MMTPLDDEEYPRNVLTTSIEQKIEKHGRLLQNAVKDGNFERFQESCESGLKNFHRILKPGIKAIVREYEDFIRRYISQYLVELQEDLVFDSKHMHLISSDDVVYLNNSIKKCLLLLSSICYGCIMIFGGIILCLNCLESIKSTRMGTWCFLEGMIFGFLAFAMLLPLINPNLNLINEIDQKYMGKIFGNNSMTRRTIRNLTEGSLYCKEEPNLTFFELAK